MQNNNTFTNILVVIILVLIVGFGVWYFTKGGGTQAPAPEGGNAIELNIGGEGAQQEDSGAY